MKALQEPSKEQLVLNIAFPFKFGKGYEIVLLKIGLKSNFDLQNKKIKIISNEFFEVNKQDIKVSILIRADNIRKKIKSGFHKCLLKIINDFIKRYYNGKKRKHFFVNLPQIFIANVNKENNHEVMGLEFEKLILKWKNEKNEDMIDYLDKNPDLSEKSKWNIIKNMTYKELLEAYFHSAEFEKTICELQTKSEKKNKKLGPLYIETYINLALTYIDFYTTPIDKNSPNQTPSLSNPNPGEDIFIPRNNVETLVHMLDENPPPTFIETSFGFATTKYDDDLIIIKKEENDSSNEKRSCSDDNEPMNDSFDSFDEKKGKSKSLKNIFNEHDKRFS